MTKGNSQTSKDNRLFSNLWLMSAATFRRADKIEQAKGSIQEAEVKDENNPAVWVQVRSNTSFHLYLAETRIAGFVPHGTRPAP